MRLELVDEDAAQWDAVEQFPPQAGSRSACRSRGPSAFAEESPRTIPTATERFPPARPIKPDAADDSNRCVWVGGIPEDVITGRHADTISEAEQQWAAAASDSKLAHCFRRCGNVIAVTLRRKPGVCKSWALITFETKEAADSALAADTVVDGVTLKVKRQDAETQLKKATTGALAGVYQHQQEIEETWMREMLESMTPLGDAGEEAVICTPRSFGDPVSPKAVHDTAMGAAMPALNFVAKVKRRAGSTASEREKQGQNKRQQISWETQYAIASDQLKEAANSTDLRKF